MKRVIENIKLPCQWGWVEAQDCMDVRDGTHDSPKPVESGFPLVTSKNLVNGEIDFSTCSYISKEDHDSITKRSAVCDGDILYAMIGTIGNPVLVKKTFDFSIKNVALFKFNNEIVSNRYIYYFLHSDLTVRQFSNALRGGTQKFVSLTSIRKLNIPLPSLEEQKKIAEILDAADSLRQKDKQLVEHYDRLSQSLFLDMFGDLTNNSKGFKVVTVGDVTSMIKDGPHVSPKYSEIGVPILSTRNIRPSKLVMDDVKYVSIEMYKELTKRFCPQKGDVLLTKGGTTGYAKVVDFEWDFCIWVHIAALRPKKTVINSKYLEAALNSYYCYQQSQLFTKGIANKDLGLKRIVNILLLLPPLEIQNYFEKVSMSIEKQKELAQRALIKSDDLFNSLLKQAFKGELTNG